MRTQGLGPQDSGLQDSGLKTQDSGPQEPVPGTQVLRFRVLDSGPGTKVSVLQGPEHRAQNCRTHDT